MFGFLAILTDICTVKTKHTFPMEEHEYLEHYEQRLEKLLAGIYGSEGQLMDVAELEERWHEFAPEYMADAVGQINSYPAFTLAVAAYVGMALAAWWDTAWERHEKETYDDLKRLGGGFDTVDEYILKHILSVEPESPEREQIENAMRTLAHAVMNAIQHEQIEKQTTRAFYILARSAKVMFRAGVTYELMRRGYHYERVKIANPVVN